MHVYYLFGSLLYNCVCVCVCGEAIVLVWRWLICSGLMSTRIDCMHMKLIDIKLMTGLRTSNNFKVRLHTGASFVALVHTGWRCFSIIHTCTAEYELIVEGCIKLSEAMACVDTTKTGVFTGSPVTEYTTEIDGYTEGVYR